MSAIVFLAYSRAPYDPGAHGDETSLEAELAFPQVMERVWIDPPAKSRGN